MKAVLIAAMAIIGMGVPWLVYAEDNPCLKIEKACEAGGFSKGAATVGKALYVDCMQPILEGKSVPGVSSVSNETIQACKNIEAFQREEREKKKSRK